MTHTHSEPILFAGSSHPALAEEICKFPGIQLGRMDLRYFPDGETSLQILDNVRGRDVFVLQTVALNPNHFLVELLIIIDALKRASAKSIVAIIPYFGYSRQDRKDKPRVPITAKLVANLLVEAGATRVLTIDLHAGQIEGFFDIPVDHLHGCQTLINHMHPVDFKNCVVVAPDMGSVKIARSFANQIHADCAVIDKNRSSSSEVNVNTLIGDVKGKDVLLADDMCSTGATLVSAAKACREKGALHIFAVVTHGLFVGPACERIENSEIEAVWMTNTIPYNDRLAGMSRLKIVSVAPLLYDAIRCIATDESVSSIS